jgi:hypothetical protein
MAPPNPYFGNPYMGMGMGTPNLINPSGNPLVDEALRKAMTPIAKDIYNNPGNVAKGALSAPFTAAPDLLGLIPGVNISGDPIREFIGLDPSSPAGILGEFMDPTSTALKGAKWLGKGLLALPLVPPAVLLKRGFDSEPLFHGTNRGFERFERSQRGSTTGARSAKRGVWLTDDPDLAGAYADLARSEELGKGWDKVMELERQGRYDAAIKLQDELEKADEIEAAGQNIRPSRVRGKFMEVDMEGADYSASGTSDRIHDIISEAESKGFDGVRFKNLSDDPRPFTNKPSTHVLVFDEKNIAGEFDFIDDVGDEALQRSERAKLPEPADPGSVEEIELTDLEVDDFRQRVRDYNKPKPTLDTLNTETEQVLNKYADQGLLDEVEYRIDVDLVSENPKNVYRALADYEDWIVSEGLEYADAAEKKELRTHLKQIRQTLIDLGHYREISPEEMANTVTMGGKKYDFAMNKKKYVWDKHLDGFLWE